MVDPALLEDEGNGFTNDGVLLLLQASAVQSLVFDHRDVLQHPRTANTMRNQNNRTAAHQLMLLVLDRLDRDRRRRQFLQHKMWAQRMMSSHER